MVILSKDRCPGADDVSVERTFEEGTFNEFADDDGVEEWLAAFQAA